MNKIRYTSKFCNLITMIEKTSTFVKFLVLLNVIINLGACTVLGKSAVKSIISTEGLERVTYFNDSCMSNNLWTGAVVMVGTLKQGIIFSKAFGYTSIEKKVRMPEDAIFDMASITKPVATATALAICVDRGLIDISAPFNQYLPEYSGTLKENITVSDLARHISGFNNRKPYIKEGKVTESILNLSPVQGVGKFDYACCNYIFLGMIVEKVTNEPLDKFCQTNIFSPLRMKDTQWTPLKKPNEKLVVKPIFSPELGVVSDEPARAAKHPIGNAGLFSTAEDLSKYCRMVLNNGSYKGKCILPETAFQLLITKQDQRSPVSFGWRIDSKYNPSLLSDRTLSHTGFTGGSVWIDLDQQKFVIILTNRTGDHGKAINARIRFADILLKEIKDN